MYNKIGEWKKKYKSKNNTIRLPNKSFGIFVFQFFILVPNRLRLRDSATLNLSKFHELKSKSINSGGNNNMLRFNKGLHDVQNMYILFE